MEGMKNMRKEMIYQADRKEEAEVLATGFCFGLLYYILNLGTHPTAYIRIPKNNKFYGKEAGKIDVDVHGGITYSEEGLYVEKGKEIEGWFIGWDYGHYGDYLGFEERYPLLCRTGGKKWTTDEIFAEVREACYQIQASVEVEKEDDRAYLVGQKDGLIHSLQCIMTAEQNIRKDIELLDKEINKGICRKNK